MMNKLTINRIAYINPHWIALRFTGSDSAFRSMNALLGRQHDYNAYWSPTALDGTGAWIVRLSWLRHYKGQFVNLDRALVSAERQVAQEGLRP